MGEREEYMAINFTSLYYRNPYCSEFEAEVLRCEGPNEKGEYHIILSDSAFYPEGGGQPGDRGSLGSVRVLDTRFVHDEHVHICDAPLSPGQKIRGRLDFERRFDFMQQHSGEHLLSGLAKEHYGATNVGFHINEFEMTLDFDKEISEQDGLFLEDRANEIVIKNLDIEILFPEEKQLTDLDYRSKIDLSGPVRIVHIAGVDDCACCGTHVKKTGEIGLIKLVDMVKYKGGVRITCLCGRRALKDYRHLAEQAAGISQAFSLNSRELMPDVARNLDKISALEDNLKKRNEELVEILSSRAKGQYLLWFDPILDKKTQKVVAKYAAEAGLAACFSFIPLDPEGPENQYRYVLHAPEAPLDYVQKALSKAFPVRGGGRGGFFQGQVEAGYDELCAFFEREFGPELFIWPNK